MADIFDMADTWNDSGTTFAAIKMDVTDTASAADSRLLDLLLGGESLFSVSKTGEVVIAGADRGANAKATIGNNTPTGDYTSLLLASLQTNPLSGGGAHGIRDESQYSPASSGGYASFDSIPKIDGSVSSSHMHSFQSRISYQNAGVLDAVAGLTYQVTHNSDGTITNSYGVIIDDALGAGTITNQYGIYIKSLTRGASNFAIYAQGNAPTYLGGSLQIGGALTMAGTITGVTSFSASLGLRAQALTSIGTLDDWNAAGGAYIAGNAGTEYAALQGYSAPGVGKYLSINPAGGNVGINTTAPATALHVAGAITAKELSADPLDPAEGHHVIWQSDGTGSGDDGDIMIKITAGAVTKTGILVDYSAL